MCQSFEVDLRAWIRSDLDAIRHRFEHAVAGVVPRDRWTEPVPAATPAHQGSSTIAGLLLHVSYHHDLALSTATLDRAPLMEEWRDRLGLGGCRPETGLAEREDRDVVERIDLDALVDYFGAVSDLTSEWTHHMGTVALDSIAPNCRRLEQRAGVRASEVPWFHAMWDGKTVGWLVQWEAIGHPYSHLGEMIAIRNQLGLSPF